MSAQMSALSLLVFLCSFKAAHTSGQAALTLTDLRNAFFSLPEPCCHPTEERPLVFLHQRSKPAGSSKRLGARSACVLQ